MRRLVRGLARDEVTGTAVHGQRWRVVRVVAMAGVLATVLTTGCGAGSETSGTAEPDGREPVARVAETLNVPVWGLVLDPQEDVMYVATSQDSALLVFDLRSYEQVGMVDTAGDRAVAVAIDGRTRTVYVADGGILGQTQGTVSVIDADTRETVDTITVEPNGVALAVDSAGGELYVAHPVFVVDSGGREVQADGIVSAIDTDSREVVATIPVGRNPRAIAIEPNRGLVFVANTESDSVSVIDSATREVVDTIMVGPAPWGLAVDDDTGLLWVANSNLGNEGEGFPPPASPLSLVDVDSLEVIETVTVGTEPMGVALDPAAGAVYVAGMDFQDESPGGFVWVVDAVSREVLDTITVGNLPGHVAVDPRTGTVYVSNMWDGTLSVLVAQ